MLKTLLTRILLVLLIIVSIIAFLRIRNNIKNNSIGTTTSNNESFFSKPGQNGSENLPSSELNINKISSNTQNIDSTIAELEDKISKGQGSSSDYNLLATMYYKKGDKDKALEIINEGLAKNPNDSSILKTKDLIENILPNL